ncbi:MAG: TolC family protein [Nitrospirae bacterium]|nr:TolC family protein [Nitrospirota bacterium]
MTTRPKPFSHYLLIIVIFLLFNITHALADELDLQALIDEALQNNHDILMSEAGVSASKFRVSQEESLPDPMVMFGYQNDGVRDLYTFGDEMGADSQWMFSVSQMFPFPGKLPLKGRMASSNAESRKAALDSMRLKLAARVKELYYELFLTYKKIDLIHDMSALFSRIEDAALARYSSGMALQQEVLMAQTEKYMLLEKEEMLKQKIQSLEAMLNATLGRSVSSPLGRTSELSRTEYNYDPDELIKVSFENSPEIKAGEKMIAEAETRVEMAKKEYYPDFTVNASYFAKGPDFPDMWSLTTSINIPLFYRTKQRHAVHEAGALLSGTVHERDATKFMLSSGIRDNYSMLTAAERLMDLYKNGLVPKTYQDFESALAGYSTGKVEALTVITRLKSLVDFEILYWVQFVEREKAIARLEALTTVGARSSRPFN